MTKVEIASYPKSGNSLFRHISKDFLSKLNENEFYLPPDIHEQYNKIKNFKGQFINKIGSLVLLYKSHIFNNPEILPDYIIHIYRHPLDVFLSSRNSLFNQSKRFNKNRLNSLFINGKPKSVEQISHDNEMDHYFNEFLEQTGTTYWQNMLGDNSNYFKYVMKAIQNENSISIRYEDLIENASGVANKAFSHIWSSIPYISVNMERINKITKYSGYKNFYWKSMYKNYENFLSQKQIDSFTKKYRDELCILKYPV